MNSVTRYAQSGDVHIAYQVVGDGDLDIILIPGWFTQVELAWTLPGQARFLRMLSDLGRVILFDKRGTGLSDRIPPHEIPDFEERTDDILTVMDAAGSRRAALVGVSEGGAQALLFSALHPDRVLAAVAIGAWVRMLATDDFPEGLDRELVERTFDWIVTGWGSGADVKLFAPSHRDDELFRTSWSTYQRHAASPGTAATYARTLLEMDIRAALPEVRVPTLVVHAARDRVVPVTQGRYLADHIAGARYIELDSDDHLPFLDDDDATLREIERFLTGRVRSHPDEQRFACILVTDIVGSTDLAARDGDRRWRTRLDGYETAAARTVTRYDGEVVKSTGDGTVAAFPEPLAAVRAAGELHAEAVGLDLELRIGLHCGLVEVRGTDLGGLAMHIATRVCAEAGAGQTLLSGTIRDVLLGASLRLTEHATRELRGVPGTWRLYALGG